MTPLTPKDLELVAKALGWDFDGVYDYMSTPPGVCPHLVMARKDGTFTDSGKQACLGWLLAQGYDVFFWHSTGEVSISDPEMVPYDTLPAAVLAVLGKEG